jgi:hypothetical protein
MSSRLAVDSYGRLVAEGTCLELRGLRWLVVDMFEIFTPPGRPPTAREMLAARTPYNAPKPTSEVPDEELDDAEAIRQAMIERRRQALRPAQRRLGQHRPHLVPSQRVAVGSLKLSGARPYGGVRRSRGITSEPDRQTVLP